MEKVAKLDIFYLKLIAVITMTISHVAVALRMFVPSFSYDLYVVLMAIGKIAFPIYVFCLLEGLTHTSNIKKYLLRLGIGAAIIFISLLVINIPTIGNSLGIKGFETIGNIFLSLFMMALFFYLFEKRRVICKVFACLIPLYFIGSFVLQYLSVNSYIIFKYHFIYDGLYAQYPIVGFFSFLIIYIGYKIYNSNIEKVFNKDEEMIRTFKTTFDYQKTKNFIASITFVFIGVLCYIFGNLVVIKGMSKVTDLGLLSYISLAAIFTLFYSGKLGYSNKVIKYGFYLYYPIHLIILFIIFGLIL